MDEARGRLVRLARSRRTEDEPEVEVRPAAANGKHAERARELLQRPGFEKFRETK
jgi:hypothetical protein